MGAARQGTDRHPLRDRGHDLYETPPEATRSLMRATTLPDLIWEPAAGRGAIVAVLRRHGRLVAASDLVAYPDSQISDIETGFDFLMATDAPSFVLSTSGLEWSKRADAIVTNPPYKLADAFIRHGLGLGLPFYALLRLAALEGARRSDLIDNHLTNVWVGIERLPMLHRDGWSGPKQATSTLPYAWFLFRPEKRTGPIHLERISWRQHG